jgi:hypothetical protein
MLTMLFAVLGGLSPHSSNIRLSVVTIWPGRTRRQASINRHLAALTAVHPSGDSTSSGPRIRKRIRAACPNARSPPLPGERDGLVRQEPASRGFSGLGRASELFEDPHLTTTWPHRKSESPLADDYRTCAGLNAGGSEPAAPIKLRQAPPDSIITRIPSYLTRRMKMRMAAKFKTRSGIGPDFTGVGPEFTSVGPELTVVGPDFTGVGPE